MSEEVPDSLRRHRQTSVAPNSKVSTFKKGHVNVTEDSNQFLSVHQRDKDKVGDMVKRRMSSRFPMVIPGLSNIPALPENAHSMLNENASDSQSKPRGRQRGYSNSSEMYHPEPIQHGGDTEEQMLNSPNFNAKTYISKSLSGATDAEVSRFAEKLIGLQEQSVIDRKDMVYKNYKTFLSVGEQITILGSELKILRKLVNDFHVANTAIKEDAEQYLSNLRETKAPERNDNFQLQLPNVNRQNNRNSVLMLENMWAQDLSKLFKMVEGAQKYLPVMPGRHVIFESSGWYQLHAATWKPLQPIHVVVLNDHLLIATKKKHRNETSLSVQPMVNLVADKCWPLLEVDIQDLSRSQDQSLNGFMVVSGTSSYVYKAESPEPFKGVMNAYRRAIRDLRPPPQKQQQPTQTDKKGHSRHTSMDISERTRNLREIDDLVNDLDVKIAHRKFMEAVDIIERNLKQVGEVHEILPEVVLTAQNAPATLAVGANINIGGGKKGTNANPLADIDIQTLQTQILKVKLDQRTKELSDLLLADIAQDYLGPSAMKNHIQMLIKLGQPEAVKKAFLNSRRQLINKRVKKVEFKGNIPAYIAQIATIHFRMIRTTVNIYQHCYPLKESSSAIVEWAKEEVEDFVVTFARQLYNVEPTSEVYLECADITKSQSKQLREVGLNLDFLLDFIYDGSKK